MAGTVRCLYTVIHFTLAVISSPLCNTDEKAGSQSVTALATVTQMTFQPQV